MARIPTRPSGDDNPGIRTATGITGTIIGVELFKEIPQGFTANGRTPIPTQNATTGNIPGGVRVRPTNVTATCGETVETADNFILLHNGPAGGFTQNYRGGATLFFNSVVRAVITDQA